MKKSGTFLTYNLKSKIQCLIIVFIIIFNVPAKVNAQKIGTGLSTHTIAAKADGTVYTWGANLYGGLGNGQTTPSHVPVAVVDGGINFTSKTITAVAAGNFHSIALASDGKVYTWGYNEYGQLGKGNHGNGTETNVPVAVVAGNVAFTSKSIIAVAAGYYHSIALASDGAVYTWGYNYYGQLGNGYNGYNTDSDVPVAVVDGEINFTSKNITFLAAGFNHSIALASDGTVYTWGYNGYGELGNNTGTNSNVPVAVDISGVLSGKTITAVAAGQYHSIALGSDGKVYTWGYNGYGQLGNGWSNSHVPVAVNISGVLSGKTITAVAAGYSHSIALDSDGKVYTWGNNGYGQLGNPTVGGSYPYTNVPVAVSGLSGKTITAIAAGYAHSMALASDGTVYTWGKNDVGQLGNGSTTTSNVPVAVVQTDMGALPVELTSFTASTSNNIVTLAWRTATEVNNYGFSIERIGETVSGGIGEWIEIGFVQGSGNSNSPKEYAFVDSIPPSGNLKYRLKQIDTDGSYEYYSTIAEVNLSPTGVEEKELPKEFALLQNYPNPFNPSTVISWQSPVGSWQTLKVYDALGKEVVTLLDEYKDAGRYEVEFKASSLSSGLYFYRITSGSYSETRKMILLR